MKVEVYYNLHRHLFSIRHKGKVIGHRRHVSLTDVKFAVQPAGRKKVLETGQKNVHAFVRGELVDYQNICHLDMPKQVTYNPHKYESFVNKKDKSPIKSAGITFMCKPTDGGPQIFAGA